MEIPGIGRFDWDTQKADSSARKHRVTFEEAATVFTDPLYASTEDLVAYSWPDDAPRYVTIGRSLLGRLLVVIHSERGGLTRIISARAATRLEHRRYEEEP